MPRNREYVALKNYIKKSDDRLVKLARDVETNLTNNESYPNPPVVLKTFGDKIFAFNTAIPNKADRNEANSAIKNNLRAELLVMLNTLRNYVNGTANGVREILLTSGFDVAPEIPEKVVVYKPENVKIVNTGFEGEAKISCKAQKVAKAYEARVRLTNEVNDWKQGFVSTKSKFILVKGLVPGKQYEFEVRVIGAGDESPWSDAILLRVG